MADKKIVIVDDDEHIRILIQAQLKSLGDTTVFSSAISAKESFEKNGFPDLVITDIDMPTMSGLELLEWIRKKSPEVPVLLVSAFHSDDNIFKALEMGATDFICKPFPLRNITQATKAALKTTMPKGNLSINNDAQWTSFVFDSNHEYLRRVNNLITTLLEKKYSKKIINDIRLAIEEIGTNAIEWGNNNSPDLKVTIKYRVTDKKITIVIKDEGAGFQNLGLPSSTTDFQQTRRDLGKREGGYGLHLVEKLCDEVMYNESGNLVALSLYLESDSRQEGTAS